MTGRNGKLGQTVLALMAQEHEHEFVKDLVTAWEMIQTQLSAAMITAVNDAFCLLFSSSGYLHKSIVPFGVDTLYIHLHFLVDSCNTPPESRVDCGPLGDDPNKAMACYRKGCCWDDSQMNSIWCYRKGESTILVLHNVETVHLLHQLLNLVL